MSCVCVGGWHTYVYQGHNMGHNLGISGVGKVSPEHNLSPHMGKTAKSYESKSYLVNFNIVTVTLLPQEHRKR